MRYLGVAPLLILAGTLLFVGDLCATSEGGKRLVERLPALDYVRSQLCQSCDLEGVVGDCGCDFDTVNKANHQYFYPLLKNLVKRTFFQYFKVNLRKDCPFWDEEHMCAIRDCEVLECEASEVPAVWIERDEEGRAKRVCSPGLEVVEDDHRQQQQQQAGGSDHNLVAGLGSGSQNITTSSELEARLGGIDWGGAKAGVDKFEGWAEDNNRVWIEQEDEERQMTYVNLLRNPERFTGYAGPSAVRVWRSIYQENCFTLGSSELDHHQCFEKRIFYRLISGLQASISTHLALDYFDSSTEEWVRNTELYLEKVGKYPDRITNLYFTYLFMMRALNKAATELANYEYITGNPQDDEATVNLMKDLVVWAGNPTSGDPASVVPVCQRGFDEKAMFRLQEPGSSSTPAGYMAPLSSEVDMANLREEFHSRFHNISRIMDCVGCGKCRLWGKLQVLGLGTAIKILLGSEADLTEGGRFSFTRNEVIALVNTAHQLAKSVDAVDSWPQVELDERLHAWAVRLATLLLTLGVVWALLSHCLFGQQPATKSTSSGSKGKKGGTAPAPAAAGGQVVKEGRRSKKVD